MGGAWVGMGGAWVGPAVLWTCMGGPLHLSAMAERGENGGQSGPVRGSVVDWESVAFGLET